jgi:hypothetical protein
MASTPLLPRHDQAVADAGKYDPNVARLQKKTLGGRLKRRFMSEAVTYRIHFKILIT